MAKNTKKKILIQRNIYFLQGQLKIIASTTKNFFLSQFTYVVVPILIDAKVT